MSTPATAQTIAIHGEKNSRLKLGIKIALLALLLGASYFNIRVAFEIHRVAIFYHAMHSSGPVEDVIIGMNFSLVHRGMQVNDSLPWDAGFVFGAHIFLLMLAFALPVVALAFFVKSARHTALITRICLLFVAGQYIFTYRALAAPFEMSLERM